MLPKLSADAPGTANPWGNLPVSYSAVAICTDTNIYIGSVNT